MVHSRHFAKEQVDAYFEAVRGGRMWPPLPRPGWHILAQEHGVVHKRDRHLYKVTGDCKRCGQTRGLMRYWFGENDNQPAEMVCWWCWAMLWKGTVGEFKFAVARYWDEIKRGMRRPPATKPAWKEMQEIYGIPDGCTN